MKKRLFGLVLNLLLLISLTARAVAQEPPTEVYLQPRSEQVFLYEGINLTTGLTQVDSTVLPLIIGGYQGINRISAPAIQPLFTFSPWVDLYFGLSPDPERPVLLVGQNLKGLTVVEAFTPTLFADIDLIPDPLRQPSAATTLWRS